MPLLSIHSNITLSEAQQQQLLKTASQKVAETLGKPEGYVMVTLHTPVPMLFAGESAPLAYLELKSIGLQENQTTDLSAMLCQLMADYDIPAERIYIEFADAPRKMWGWNSSTF